MPHPGGSAGVLEISPHTRNRDQYPKAGRFLYRDKLAALKDEDHMGQLYWWRRRYSLVGLLGRVGLFRLARESPRNTSSNARF